MVNKEILEVLVCPKCKGGLELKGAEGLLCKKCRLIYPIRNGIIIMLEDEAKKV